MAIPLFLDLEWGYYILIMKAISLGNGFSLMIQTRWLLPISNLVAKNKFLRYFPLTLIVKGDEVLAVNGDDVRGKSAFEVSSLLQGPNETYVTIVVVPTLNHCNSLHIYLEFLFDWLLLVQI